MYVITVDVDGVRKYGAIDMASGGYPYFTEAFSSAKIYKDYDETVEVLRGYVNSKDNKMSDGSIFPSPELHGALGLNNLKLKATGLFKIQRIELKDTNEIHIVTKEIK